MANTVDKVINIASAEVGYLEKKSNSNLDSKTANAGSNNYTKYGKVMGCNGSAWCDAFVDWIFVQAYGREKAKEMLGGFSNYTPTSAQYFKNMGRFYKSKPKIGDVIFFKNSIRICHTGIVYKVDNTYVYTIEGNTSGASGVVANGGGVCKKKYKLNYSKIAGYGRSKYDTVVKTTSSVKNEIVAQGQQHAINFTGYSIKVDGVRGNETKTIGVMVLQHAMNLDYGKPLITVDGDFGTKSNTKLGSHYVKRGETQYMVTALEILLMLNGYDPKGLELPGNFGNGLESTVKQYQKDKGLSQTGVANASTFKSLIS